MKITKKIACSLIGMGICLFSSAGGAAVIGTYDGSAAPDQDGWVNMLPSYSWASESVIGGSEFNVVNDGTSFGTRYERTNEFATGANFYQELVLKAAYVQSPYTIPYFAAANGDYTLLLNPIEGAVRYTTAAGWKSWALDTSVYHTYRLEGAGATGRLFVDNVLVDEFVMEAARLISGNYNYLVWGDACQSCVFDLTIDNIEWGGDYVAAPAPSALALLGGALVTMAGFRRSRRRNRVG